MEKIEIKWLKSCSVGIAQIYDSGLEYAFVSDDMRQCHDFVYCKDFLQDVIQAHLHKRPASIYGFNYNPASAPAPCMQRTRILLANSSDKDFRSKMPNLLDFVNQFARQIKLKRTQIIEAVSQPKKYAKGGVFLTDGSPMWMNSPPLLSLYALLLRSGCVHTAGMDVLETINEICSGKIKPYQREDVIQLHGALPGIKKILKLGYRKLFYIDSTKNYPAKQDIDTMHDSCGIMGFSNGLTKDIVKYWHRKSLLEAEK